MTFGILFSYIVAVFAKYAGHVRHNVEMSGREFKYCRTFCAAVANMEKMSDREKCPAAYQNVGQSTECLPDKISGRPKIILANTVVEICDTDLHTHMCEKTWSKKYRIDMVLTLL